MYIIFTSKELQLVQISDPHKQPSLCELCKDNIADIPASSTQTVILYE